MARKMRELPPRPDVIFLQEPDGSEQLFRRGIIRGSRQGGIERFHGVIETARPVVAHGQIEMRRNILPIFLQHLPLARFDPFVEGRLGGIVGEFGCQICALVRAGSPVTPGQP